MSALSGSLLPPLLSCLPRHLAGFEPPPFLMLGGNGIQHLPNVSDPRIFGAVSTLTHVYLYRVNYQGLLAKTLQRGYCGVGLSPTQRCSGVFSFGWSHLAMHED